MSYRVLLSAPYLIPAMEDYRQYFDRSGIELVVADVQERLSEDELMIYAGNIDGALCGDDRFTAKVLESAAPRLKVISKWGTGIDSIDVEAARRLNVGVFNTPGAFTQPVADSVMGYILTFARRLHSLDSAVRENRWSKVRARALNECTLGVVGVGRIGRAVLSRAKAFGMHLLGTDIIEVDPEFVRSIGVDMVPLAELVPVCDFVSLNCDLNPTSRHLFNAETLSRMKQGAVLINTARGPIVDEAALIDALRSGRIGGAALDVFEEEPLPPDSPLREMEQVLLAPHNANSSPAAWERVHWNTVRNLFIGLGLTPPDPSGDAAGSS